MSIPGVPAPPSLPGIPPIPSQVAAPTSQQQAPAAAQVAPPPSMPAPPLGPPAMSSATQQAPQHFAPPPVAPAGPLTPPPVEGAAPFAVPPGPMPIPMPAPTAPEAPEAPVQAAVPATEIPAVPVLQPAIPAAPHAQVPAVFDPGLPTAPPGPAGTMVPVQEVDFQTMSVAQAAEAMGFFGLDFNAFGATPIVSLNQGEFRTSDRSMSLGKEFLARICEGKPQYLYITDIADTDPRYSVAYTYDNETSNGKDLKGIVGGWAAQGIGYRVKKYLQLTCVLPDDRVVLLSVPETSISRFTGFFQQCFLAQKHTRDVWCRIHIGPTVTKAVKPFDPIAFEIAR